MKSIYQTQILKEKLRSKTKHGSYTKTAKLLRKKNSPITKSVP